MTDTLIPGREEDYIATVFSDRDFAGSLFDLQNLQGAHTTAFKALDSALTEHIGPDVDPDDTGEQLHDLLMSIDPVTQTDLAAAYNLDDPLIELYKARSATRLAYVRGSADTAQKSKAASPNALVSLAVEQGVQSSNLLDLGATIASATTYLENLTELDVAVTENKGEVLTSFTAPLCIWAGQLTGQGLQVDNLSDVIIPTVQGSAQARAMNLEMDDAMPLDRVSISAGGIFNVRKLTLDQILAQFESNGRPELENAYFIGELVDCDESTTTAQEPESHNALLLARVQDLGNFAATA